MYLVSISGLLIHTIDSAIIVGGLCARQLTAILFTRTVGHVNKTDQSAGSIPGCSQSESLMSLADDRASSLAYSTTLILVFVCLPPDESRI